jgi:hypothetical protein
LRKRLLSAWLNQYSRRGLGYRLYQIRFFFLCKGKKVAFYKHISFNSTTLYITGDVSRIFFNVRNDRVAYSADTDKQTYENDAVHIIGLRGGETQIENDVHWRRNLVSRNKLLSGTEPTMIKSDYAQCTLIGNVADALRWCQ